MPDQPTSSETSPLNLQYATFFVDELFFGIEVLKVQEVLRYQEMTSVPAGAGRDRRAHQSKGRDRDCDRHAPAPWIAYQTGWEVAHERCGARGRRRSQPPGR